MKIFRFEVGVMKTNCYFILDEKSGECLIVDPGDDGQYLISKCTEIGVRPNAIIATHGHFDHVMAASELQLAFSIGFFIHPEDIFLLDRMEKSAKHFLNIESGPKPIVNGTIADGDDITIGSSVGKIISLPGHTPGSIGIWFRKERVLFTGDTIFSGGFVGRTDFAYSDKTKLALSVRTILDYPEETLLYPGHGESTTVGEEKSLRDNPMS